MKKILFIFFTFLLLPSYLASAQEEARLMRFPSIHGEKIVFSYAGDLYLVSAEGGIARKITSDVGYEMFPKFSPDGSQIAFTGQYDGNTEVYLIPAEGGVPQRLTYTATLDRDIISDRMGPNNIVMSWTPDGKNITYRSRKESFNSFKGALFNVTVDGGLSTQLPLADGGFCSYSPDGKKLAFNKIFREFRTWKYYRGGMADDIRIFDFDTKEITDITNNKAQDIEPMWAGNEIYFLSDRERTMNLFVYNTDTKETTQVTNFTDYDIKFPSIGKSNLVFEKGGYIYKVNLKTKQVEKVNIEIDNDFIYARQELKDASKEIRDADISPNGERVVFSARGDVYTVPAKEGVTYNLTQTSGVHERDATWSPDGKYIAWIADNTGEFEIYIQKQDGSEPPVQLTSGADTYKFTAIWSPDSKKLLWGDQKFRLRYIDIDSKKVTLVKQAKNSRINDYNWSPDSKWIAYTDLADNNMSVVDVYNLDTKETHVITSEWFDNSNPSFSDDGKYIVFSSGRNFSPTYSQIEWNYAYLNMSSLYMIPLLKSTPSPFAPENDMVKTEEPEKESSDKKGKDKKEEKTEGVQVNIDFDGITDRTISIPVEPSNYFNPQMIGNKIYYYDYSRGNGGLTAKVYDLKKKEETELGSGIRYVISANHKKMLVREHGKYAVIDLPSGKISLKETMDLSNMKVMVDYAKEWKQIFNESWRQMRDFFYVSNMHGLDWKAIHDKYAVLVPYVKQRDDLTYIIGEMIGELSIGHAYVESGDRPEVKKIKTGLLGAQLTKDASGFFKIDKILKGANWDDALRSPLTEVGIDVKEGSYILAVDGNSTKDMKDIYRSLVGKANTLVELTVNTSPSFDGSRKIIVKPLADESQLYYYDWVQGNIKKVNEATDGQIGYIHIPDMVSEGLNEFVKHYYPQLKKKGVIIDDRGNGGGNVSPMILERLQREVYRATMERNASEGNPVPYATIHGPKVLLIDSYSASDGDLFAFGFKKLNLGTVIGQRTWGGVVGISGTLPFIDGADLRKPEFASYSSDKSEWIIEGHGVEPDIEVSNNPYDQYMGKDAQLQKAIEVIMGQLDQYKPIPPIPPAPDKSKQK